MASDELEEKINKIRLQNEEIRRRHEEVEADKKNAAKLNALVQLVPSDDWPERKEPPEFSAPSKNVQKPKSVGKEHSKRPSQHYSGIQERIGEKDHKFAQGEGPPPDPKYNFLADSEREMRGIEDAKSDEDKTKTRNKTPRGGSRKRGGGAGGGGGGSREAFFKDNRGPNAFHSKEESLPEYEAWRAERNKIDEARIKRQKTAEGNWRREWDSNKTSIDKEPFKKGDSNRKDYERKNNYYNNDYSDRGHGGNGSRTYHGSQKNHGQQDHRRPYHEQTHEYKRDNKRVNSPTDDRSTVAIDKSVKVTVNQAKGPVMSVKVNSPSIAGTGRVGPRQKSRVTYSSQSDAEMSTHEVNNFSRQKSFDEKTATANFTNGPKAAPKSPFTQRKKDGNAKSPFTQRKEYKNDESSVRPNKNPKTSRNEGKDQRQSNNSASKPQRVQRRTQKPTVDKNETVSASDNAIPSEYNPEKPLNLVETAEPKVDSKTNSENISEENNLDVTLQGSLKNSSDDSVIKTEQNVCDAINNLVADNNVDLTLQDSLKNSSDDSVNETEQNICDTVENLVANNNKVTEDFETLVNLETDVNTENIEIEKNLEKENNQDNDQPEKEEIKFETSDTNQKIKCEIKEDNNGKPIEEIKSENKENVSNENLIKEIERENKENDSIEKLDVPELQTLDILEEKNDTFVNSQENISKVVKDTIEEVNVTVSPNIDEEEIISEQKNDKLIETNTSESQQTNVISKIESDVKSVTNVTNDSIELKKLNNEKEDDNIVDYKINDQSIEIDETKPIEILGNSQNISVNDSGFVEDSDNFNNTLTIESNEGNNDKNFQDSDKSDSKVLTKEICEITKICDIRAASSEIPQAVEVHVEKNEDKQELSKALEDSTKDCESSETSKINEIQKVMNNEKPVQENAVEEKSTIAIEESKKD